jgi:ATP adenylyltransferase
MVIPYAHLASPVDAPDEQSIEMTQLLKRCIRGLQSEYRPEGFNIGMNLGLVAGAGVRDHYHLHVVPRWAGDANFMTITGETRVLPEDLPATYARLKKTFTPETAPLR